MKSKNGQSISTAQELFDRHVVKGDDCWSWGGYINNKGYGYTRIGGKVSKGWLAHRLSWSLHFGEIPDGLHVCHKCDNRMCVRPDHLFLGTNMDNIRDRMQKGRLGSQWCKNIPREMHPKNKIKLTQLMEMIALRESGKKVMDIAQEFGITKEHASRLMTKFKQGDDLGFHRC
jgi:hypothetical protein